MKTICCALCGDCNPHLLFTSRDRSHTQNTTQYSLCQCPRCDLIYLNPRPDTPDELAQIYPANYESYMRSGQRLLRMMRRLAWQPEACEIYAFTDASSRILEVGCATGEFLAMLRRCRPGVEGIEFNANVAAIARERYDLLVRAGDISAADDSADTFDVVVMRHVFEHVPDPIRVLRTVSRILRPGGRFIFTIPNVDSAGMRIFGPDWYGWQVPRHFYLFPRATLLRMLHEQGLELVSLTYAGVPNVWIGSARHWLEARGFATLARFVRYENPLALALFAPIGLVAARLKTSGTIRVIAQRPDL